MVAAFILRLLQAAVAAEVPQKRLDLERIQVADVSKCRSEFVVLHHDRPAFADRHPDGTSCVTTPYPLPGATAHRHEESIAPSRHADVAWRNERDGRLGPFALHDVDSFQLLRMDALCRLDHDRRTGDGRRLPPREPEHDTAEAHRSRQPTDLPP